MQDRDEYKESKDDKFQMPIAILRPDLDCFHNFFPWLMNSWALEYVPISTAMDGIES